MSRALAAAMLSQIVAGKLRPVVFYEGAFSTGTLRLWTGLGDKIWNGQTWSGAGNMLGWTTAKESATIQAIGFTIALNGESQALLSVNLSAVRQGLIGTVWLGALDASDVIVDSPFVMFKGRLDVPDLIDDGYQCTLSVAYESRLVDLTVARIRRYTNEDQNIDYPNDRGFEFVPGLQDHQVMWGPNVVANLGNSLFGNIVRRALFKS